MAAQGAPTGTPALGLRRMVQLRIAQQTVLVSEDLAAREDDQFVEFTKACCVVVIPPRQVALHPEAVGVAVCDKLQKAVTCIESVGQRGDSVGVFVHLKEVVDAESLVAEGGLVVGGAACRLQPMTAVTVRVRLGNVPPHAKTTDILSILASVGHVATIDHPVMKSGFRTDCYYADVTPRPGVDLKVEQTKQSREHEIGGVTYRIRYSCLDVIPFCAPCKQFHPNRACPWRGKCLNCHQEGHDYRQCPEDRRVTCFNCREVGHVSRNCPHEKAGAWGGAPQGSVPGGSPPYLPRASPETLAASQQSAFATASALLDDDDSVPFGGTASSTRDNSAKSRSPMSPTRGAAAQAQAVAGPSRASQDRDLRGLDAAVGDARQPAEPSDDPDDPVYPEKKKRKKKPRGARVVKPDVMPQRDGPADSRSKNEPLLSSSSSEELSASEQVDGAADTPPPRRETERGREEWPANVPSCCVIATGDNMWKTRVQPTWEGHVVCSTCDVAFWTADGDGCAGHVICLRDVNDAEVFCGSHDCELSAEELAQLQAELEAVG